MYHSGLEAEDCLKLELVSAIIIVMSFFFNRLAALQKSGDTDWKKRLMKVNPEDDLTVICSTAQINHHHVSHVSVCIETNSPIQQWQV
jgi:hypothetical protein